MRTIMSWNLLFVATLAIGCAKPAARPAAVGSTSTGSGTTTGSATATDTPAGQVRCTLDCSGTEAHGYGETEAEARADVSRYIEQNCKPEDGQYFLFCDDAK